MAKTFQQRLRQKTTKKYFIGRETELAFFAQLLTQPEPDYLILLVHGLGGVGKTWLLNQWEQQARDKEQAVARVNDGQRSVEELLKKFRDDLVEQGFDFDSFDKSYQQFRRLKSEAEKALSQWEETRGEGLVQTAGRLTGTSIAVIARLFSPSREALELLGGREKVERAFAEGFGYLRKWVKSKDDLEFLENPLAHVTHSFADDLNRISRKKRVVLFFDTYEYLAPFSDEWLCNTFFRADLNERMLFVFGGRDAFSPNWLDYQPLARQIPLDVFTDEEAHAYLRSRDVTDPQIVEEILHLSGRLPVYLAMLTSGANALPQAAGNPTETVVERFLKWIPKGESDKRRAVVWCAFPRSFDRDLVQAMMNSETSTGAVRDIFDWLHALPFISFEKGRGWVYHEVVRTQILRYTYQESRQEYHTLHEKALRYYRQNPRRESEEEELYHLFHLDREQGMYFGLTGLFKARTKGKSSKAWTSAADDIVRQVDRERSQGEPCSQIWQERLTQVLEKKPEAENTVKQIGEDESLSPAGRSRAYNTLGILLKSQQRYEEAEQAYRQAIELDPNYALAYKNLGNLLKDQQRYEEAEQAFRQAIELDPNYTRAYNNLGNLLKDQQRYKEAEQAYRQAIELDPKFTWTYNALGILLANQQRYDEAEQAYRQAIEHDQNDAWAYNTLGILLYNQQRYDEAEQTYRQAIELDPEYAGAYNRLGILLADQQRYAEAEQVFRQTIELDPEYAWAYNHLGILLADQQRDAEAEQTFLQAIELDPDDARTYNNLGILLYNQQRYDEAEQAYRQAIEHDPEYAGAYYSLACLYALQHDVEHALEYLQRSIDLKPKYRSMAQTDHDFDNIRENPQFQALMAGEVL